MRKSLALGSGENSRPCQYRKPMRELLEDERRALLMELILAAKAGNPEKYRAAKARILEIDNELKNEKNTSEMVRLD